MGAQCASQGRRIHWVPMDHHDPGLPAARTLLGAGADEMVAVAVEAAGGRLGALRHAQVLYRPGRSLTVRFSAVVDWAGGARSTETIVAVAHVDGPPAGTLVLEADDERVGLFRYPHDPSLPGLLTATSPGAVGELIGRPVVPDGLTVVAYRPARRAVVRAALVGGGERYLKVVPLDQVDGLADRLERLEGVVPAPRVLARHADLGIVELEALTGSTLRDALRHVDPDDVTSLPPPQAVVAMLDDLAGADDAGLPAQWSTLDAGRGHGALLAAVLPESASRVAALVARLGPDTTAPVVVAHGDLHPAQLLVTGSSISGVLDLDDLGRGTRIDDLATFLGHLVALGAEARMPAATRYVDEALPVMAAQVDPADLRRRMAAVVVGLATGPYRVQQPGWPEACRRRIALAEHWVDADVKSLSGAS
jgi:hypothetical protein